MELVAPAIEDAAFDCHMALTESLNTSLGRKPTCTETAQAMAVAYGDMLAVYAGMGAKPDQINSINEMAQNAYASMMSKIIVSDCGGSA